MSLFSDEFKAKNTIRKLQDGKRKYIYYYYYHLIIIINLFDILGSLM
jgi:hypothetical protein